MPNVATPHEAQRRPVELGLSGWCGMATLLALMPWTRQNRTAWS